MIQARTSAKTGEGVVEAFNELVIAVYNKDKANNTTKTATKKASGVKVSEKGAKKSGGCC